MNLFTYCKTDAFKRRNFNCGGFALNCFEWVRPNVDRWIETDGKTKKEIEAEKRHILKSCAQDLAIRFDNVRIIKRERQIRKDEEIIYFRLDTENDDFHFLLKGKKKLIGKQGGLKDLDFFNPGELYKNWGDEFEYSGPIVRLAVKRTNNFPNFHRLYKKPD